MFSSPERALASGASAGCRRGGGRGDLVRLRGLALKPQHQRQVLLDLERGLRARRRLAQRLLGLVELVGQHVGKPEIVEDLRLARRQHQRLLVARPRLFVLVERIEDAALRGEELPVRIVGALRALHRRERLVELAVGGERLAEGGEHLAVLRMVDRGLAHHRNGLAGLSCGAERRRIVQLRDPVLLVCAIGGAPFLHCAQRLVGREVGGGDDGAVADRPGIERSLPTPSGSRREGRRAPRPRRGGCRIFDCRDVPMRFFMTPVPRSICFATLRQDPVKGPLTLFAALPSRAPRL